MKLLILNGPNLNLLGRREPEIYGNRNFEDYLVELKQHFRDIEFGYLQSNLEGELINALQAADGNWDGIIFNPAGYNNNVMQRIGIEAV